MAEKIREIRYSQLFKLAAAAPALYHYHHYIRKTPLTTDKSLQYTTLQNSKTFLTVLYGFGRLFDAISAAQRAQKNI